MLESNVTQAFLYGSGVYGLDMFEVLWFCCRSEMMSLPRFWSLLVLDLEHVFELGNSTVPPS